MTLLITSAVQTPFCASAAEGSFLRSAAEAVCVTRLALAVSKEELIAPNIGKCADMDESKLPDLILAEVKQKQELFCLDVEKLSRKQRDFHCSF